MSDTEVPIPSQHDDGIARTDGTIDPAHRVALSYIDRSRRYYASKGYGNPYRWSTNDSAPFQRPRRPVEAGRLAVVTTTFPVEHRDGTRPPKAVRAVASEPPPAQMYTADLFWHKTATTTDDVGSYLPLATLADLVEEGRLGSLNDRFFSVPTTYSQRSTRSDAETIASWCTADDVDLVLLIPL